MPQNDHTPLIGGRLTVYSKPLQLKALKMLRLAICKDQSNSKNSKAVIKRCVYVKVEVTDYAYQKSMAAC